MTFSILPLFTMKELIVSLKVTDTPLKTSVHVAALGIGLTTENPLGEPNTTGFPIYSKSQFPVLTLML